jgi:hypothetical protein
MAEQEELFDEDITKEQVFDFLEDLRQSGVTNMFGATPYIQNEFGIGRERARKMLLAWMDSFKD